MNLFADNRAARMVQERLAVLEGEVRNLKTANKHLELEWEELYDKVRRQMSRMSKRSAVDAPTLPNNEEIIDDDDGLDPVSRSIMLRRGMPGIRK